MMDQEERMQILDMIENGRISAEQGLQLLKALDGETEVAMTDVDVLPAAQEPASEFNAGAETFPLEQDQASPPVVAPLGEAQDEPQSVPGEQVTVLPGAAQAESFAEMQKWRRWWTIPLWIGVGVTVLGGVLMYWAMQASGLNFWFGCASLPFALGVLVIVLAFQSRTSPWLHLRVRQGPSQWPQQIAFSFPIPARPTVWFLRSFGRRIHGLNDASLDEVIQAVGETANSENPIYIRVDDDEDGEQVEIYIG
jgi:hypothetical protein